MEKNKTSVFKVIMTVLFAILVFASFFYYIFGTFDAESKIQPKYLAYACGVLCFLFSLIFVRFDFKKIVLTLSLATTVAADYFLVLNNSEENKLVGLCIFCAFQFFLMIYTLYLNGSVGVRIVNIAIRVALCLIAYFVLPGYVELGTLELVAVMYIINFFVSLLMLLFNLKTEWLLFLGCLLLFLCDIVIGLKNGGFTLLNLSGSFVDFLNSRAIQTYLYIPGLFLIATSSVFSKKKE